MTHAGLDERFDVSEGTLARTLQRALTRGGERSDVFLEHRATTSLLLEEGQVKRAAHTVDRGAGVRAVCGDRVGYAHTEELTPRALSRAADVAARVACSPVEATPAVPDLRRPASVRRSPGERLGREASAAGRVERLAALDARIRALEARVTHVTLSLTDELSVVAIARSDGRLVEDRRPRLVVRATCLGESGGRREQATVSFGVRAGLDALDDARLGRLADDLAAQLRLLFEARRPPAGQFPVVLAAGSSGILLHEAIGHGLEADFNRKGVSVFADRIGTRVASPHVTLIDSGKVPGQHGSLDVDDEGEPTAETVLVRDGVLCSYLHDSISAAHYGVASTGSARRESFRCAPLPRMRCTYLLPGPCPGAEVVGSVKRGLLASTFGNGQVQIGAGDFSFYVRLGWWIEDGRLAWPVKDVNLIGNGPKVLTTLDLVGNDLELVSSGGYCGKDGQRVPVGFGLPTVRAGNISIGGRSA